MRGVAVKTPENVAEAQLLRAQGWMLREIADRFGVKVQTVDAWLHDPDGKRHRARKDSYRRPCPECGEPMSGAEGKRNPKRCVPCCTVWTPEAVIAAIRDWADEHGGVPPTQVDWNPAHTRVTDAQRREYGTGRWPSHTTVRDVFGTWNNGLIAAGFEPHLVRDRTPDFEVLVAEVQSGMSTAALAAKYGVTREAIHQRFKNRGLRLSTFQPKRRKAAA